MRAARQGWRYVPSGQQGEVVEQVYNNCIWVVALGCRVEVGEPGLVGEGKGGRGAAPNTWAQSKRCSWGVGGGCPIFVDWQPAQLLYQERFAMAF